MKHLSKLALLAAAFFTGLSANAQSINAFGGQSVTISSDQTCTSFDVVDGSTLTVNQGVTLTLNMNDGHSFNLFDNSNLELHGTLAGSVGSGATWMDDTYINVYLSDGAKYTVTGLSCMDGDNYLRYYGYDAATDGNGTVSVTSGSTAVTASSIGYKATTYTFTATPSSGYKFKNWTKGAGGEVLGTDASINVTCEQNGQYQVYANFEEDAPATSSGPEVAWDEAKKTGQFTMPGGNVTLEPDYYPQATVADGAVTAAGADARATTDDPLVKVDATKLTGAKKLMYFVSNSGTTAPAYDAEGWTDQLPTAEGLTQQGIVYVWYYPVGTDEGVDDATATYSDGDICKQSITARIADAPTYAVTFAEGTEEPTLWKAEPATGVTKGKTVKVTYNGSKKVIGVKAEKKAKAPAYTLLDNTMTAWTAGTYAVPAGGLTYSDAITVSGDVTLTLTDGETLTLNKGISLAEGATLTVEGNGTMNINGTNNSTASTVAGTGMLVLTSGTLNAKGGDGGNASSGYTSGGGNAINGAVTVSGGTLTATGGNGGSDNSVPWYDEDEEGWVGGSGYRGDGAWAISGDVIITAGIVTAKGGNGGSLPNGSDAYAGAGGNAINGNVTLSGGTLTKTDGNSGTKGADAAGYVGAGRKAVAGTVTNNGGTVN